MSVEIRVPQLGESVVEATVGRWLKKAGDPIGPGDILVELETDKVNVEVPSEKSGILLSISHPEGDIVGINDVLGVLQEGANGLSSSAPAPAVVAVAPTAVESAPSTSTSENGTSKVASPVAQRLAADKGVDLAKVQGSGVGGKVTKEDVQSFLQTQADTPQVVVAPPAPVVERTAPAVTAPTNNLPPIVLTSPDRREERKPMTRLQLTAAHRLVEAQQTAAMLTTFNEVDMSAVMEVRKRRKESFQKQHGVGLGFMSFFTKAAIGALKAFPLVNAEIQGSDIVLKHYYDIGVAVSTEKGLVVPVLRDADRKTFAEIEKGIGELAGRARENRLTLADLTGGTFTITNGGVFGSLMSTPILNTPQVGILGMHKIQERPVVVNGEIVIRPMMYLALSYDHRLINGSEAVRFLVRIKEMIEDPETLLLEG